MGDEDAEGFFFLFLPCPLSKPGFSQMAMAMASEPMVGHGGLRVQPQGYIRAVMAAVAAVVAMVNTTRPFKRPSQPKHKTWQGRLVWRFKRTMRERQAPAASISCGTGPSWGRPVFPLFRRTCSGVWCCLAERDETKLNGGNSDRDLDRLAASAQPLTMQVYVSPPPCVSGGILKVPYAGSANARDQ